MNPIRYFKKMIRRSRKDPLKESIYEDCLRIHKLIQDSLVDNDLIITLENFSYTFDFVEKDINITQMSDETYRAYEREVYKTFDKMLREKNNYYKVVINTYNKFSKENGFSYVLSLENGKRHNYYRTRSINYIEYKSTISSEVDLYIKVVIGEDYPDDNELTDPEFLF